MGPTAFMFFMLVVNCFLQLPKKFLAVINELYASQDKASKHWIRLPDTRLSYNGFYAVHSDTNR